MIASAAHERYIRSVSVIWKGGVELLKTVGSGKYTYYIDENWAQMPPGWTMSAAAVSGDSQDRIYAFSRTKHPVMVFDREGIFLRSWGEGLIAMAHAIYVDLKDNVWLVDRDNGQILKFTPEGELLMTIGTEGYRSSTGVPQDDFTSDAFVRVTHGGDPFNLPAGVAVGPAGDVFVVDGYANSRVHHFSSEGELIKSWGEPGNGPGQFNLPHGVWVDRHDRVLVADRENNRVQVFSRDGEFLSVWPAKLIGPAVLHVDQEDVVYVPEHNGGLFSILTLDGQRLTRWGSAINRSCHGVWVDSHKDIYIVQPGDFGRRRRVVKYHRKG